jgi:hypothetical protein
MKKASTFLIPFSAILMIFACSNSNNDSSENNQNTGNTTVPEVYRKIYGASSITSDGTFITIKANGQPDHKSVYYSTTDSRYESFSGTTFGGTTFTKNPNTINLNLASTYRIPLNPVVATTHASTPLGAIGVAVNGVPFFNQYAGPNQPLTNEVTSFDQYLGHPQATGVYHYHVEPTYLTTTKGKEALMGFLLDGFPVYGPEENGVAVTNLDIYHGHTSVTADYPNGIYHYHVTNSDPYINGNGFYGTPGTVSN